MADRDSALRVLTALRRSPVGDNAVLVGSSGLTTDPTFSDSGAEGYAPVARQTEIGLDHLLTILEKLHG